MQYAPIALSGGVKVRPSVLPKVLQQLVASGVIGEATAAMAAKRAAALGVTHARVLQNEFNISPDDIALATSQSLATRYIDIAAEPPDPNLFALMGAQSCLQRCILPWRHFGAMTVILTASEEKFQANRDDLQSIYGSVCFAIAPQSDIERYLTANANDQLTYLAETKLAPEFSCRNWSHQKTGLWFSLIGLITLVGIYFASSTLFALVYGWVVAMLAAATLLKLAAIFKSSSTPMVAVNDTTDSLPTITVLVPLLQEKRIAAHLIDHLRNLEYPRALLDVCLIVEESDDTTNATLAALPLPPWIRQINVPDGLFRTKPRAMNYAMNFAQGSIIGIYDAEDAPATDQLLKVARVFAQNDHSVACVQGSLDYYNDRSNWLARCFTIEYASWFRVVLPGFAKMGLLVPLGGTTLFFRREALDSLGGWDAHNVTEDADLGVRLARRGYRTVFMDSVTQEEANARVWPWIKQRSRWLKGYAITYAVHMRNPLKLLRELGFWRFFGFQILFFGTLSQFVLAPLFWSVILIPLGFPHPLLTILTPDAFLALTGLFLFSASVNLATNCLGVHRAGKRWLMPWAPTLILYFPLGTLGALKGLFELFQRPFYWDKTEHGIDLPP